jgi:hypothetical protein
MALYIGTQEILLIAMAIIGLSVPITAIIFTVKAIKKSQENQRKLIEQNERIIELLDEKEKIKQYR